MIAGKMIRKEARRRAKPGEVGEVRCVLCHMIALPVPCLSPIILPVIILPYLFLTSSCARPRPGARALGGYVGSEACVKCHEKLHPGVVAAWRASRHRATMQGIGRDDPLARMETIAVIGQRKGRHVLLSAGFLILPFGDWKDDELFPPHDAIASNPLLVDAGLRCIGCHATAFSPSWGPFFECGVGCEACHGPGREHVESKGAKAATVNPAGLTAARANMVCGQCHSLGRDHSELYNFPMACDGETLRPFRPGEDLAAAFVDAKPKVARKGWEYSAFVRSTARYAAQRCTDCHDPHGRPGGHAMLKDPTSETCLRCHGVGRARLRYQNHAGLGDATKKPCWQCHRNAHAH
ncbi:MAG: hypothetical protein FJ291_19830 [Planctomycetes bacterium]|nr:hypothetical protein [Planctomycetota bacterium]